VVKVLTRSLYSGMKPASLSGCHDITLYAETILSWKSKNYKNITSLLRCYQYQKLWILCTCGQKKVNKYSLVLLCSFIQDSIPLTSQIYSA